jgi:hypothetical protein
MDAETQLKLMIGDLLFQVAQLRAEVEQLREKQGEKVDGPQPNRRQRHELEQSAGKAPMV